MTNWYLDLISTNQELQKRMGIRKASKFQKVTPNYTNLISEPNLLPCSIFSQDIIKSSLFIMFWMLPLTYRFFSDDDLP